MGDRVTGEVWRVEYRRRGEDAWRFSDRHDSLDRAGRDLTEILRPGDVAEWFVVRIVVREHQEVWTSYLDQGDRDQGDDWDDIPPNAGSAS